MKLPFIQRSMMSILNHAVFNLFKPMQTKWAALLILLALLGNTTLGQHLSRNGDFRLAHVSGCAPFTITPEVLFPVTNEPVLYYYDNTLNPDNCAVDINQNPAACVDTGLSSATQFTFSQPGIYYIVQIIGTSPTPRVDFIEVRVIEDRAPFIGISVCDNNNAQFIFDFSGDFFDFYNIDFGDGNTMQLPKTGDNTIIHTYSQPGTYTMTAQGQLNSGDNLSCSLIRQEQITTITRIPSPIIDSLIVEDGIESTIYYQQLNDRLVYNLEIDMGSGFQLFQSISPQTNGRSFTIRDLSHDNANEFYRYRIEATDHCGSASQYSDPISSIAFNSSLASFNNGIEVTLNWQTSSTSFNTVDFYLNQAFQQSFNTPTNNTGFTVTFSNCNEFGQMYMEHVFNGKLSRSIISTPLQGQNLDLPPPQTPVGQLNGTGITLNYSPPDFTVSEYLIFRRDESGTFQQLANVNSNSYQDQSVPTGVSQVCYAVRYVDECGNMSELSNETCITVSGVLRLPNAFTPNGDGINDEFRVADGIFQSFELLIYNRWGTLVFHSTNPTNGWRGTFNGKPAPSGTYTYRVSFANADNVASVKTGTFVLIR